MNIRSILVNAIVQCAKTGHASTVTLPAEHVGAACRSLLSELLDDGFAARRERTVQIHGRIGETPIGIKFHLPSSVAFIAPAASVVAIEENHLGTVIETDGTEALVDFGAEGRWYEPCSNLIRI